MSRENVEITRRSCDAYVSGDLESALAPFDAEIEIYDHDIPDSDGYRGLDGLRLWEADRNASWASWRWEAEELIDAGDRVVAVLQVYAKGRASGVDVERLDGEVWTLRDGKCIRLDHYGSEAEALEAVGLAR